MKKLLAAFSALVASTTLLIAANSVVIAPSSPTYSEPSQIVGTLNAFINILNGGSGAVGVGSFGAVSSATTTAVINAQKGIATYTGVSPIAQNAVATFTITNSLVAANSVCFARVISGGDAGSAPQVSTLTPTAGSLAAIVFNGGATTTTGTTDTIVIGFNCV